MDECLVPRRPVPLVAHVVQCLERGGVGSAVIRLVDHMPRGTYRHAIVCMTDYPTGGLPMQSEDVTLYGLCRRGPRDLTVYLRLRRLLQAMRPEIVHTRNLDTLGVQVMAAWSEVVGRVHGDHDREQMQPTAEGRLARYIERTWAGQHIAMSHQQVDYLTRVTGVPADRVSLVRSGVDTVRFHPLRSAGRSPFPAGFVPPGGVVIGSVMSMRPDCDPAFLARAFLGLRDRLPRRFDGLRLVIVGEGPLRASVQRLLAEAGVAEQVWLPGFRDDIPGLLRGMDVFVRPSRAEVISMALLEAMACGLPVIATRVGGNPDLVVPGETGALVPAGDVDQLTRALSEYVTEEVRRVREGLAGRRRVEANFTLDAMVSDHLAVYDKVLGRLRRSSGWDS